MVPRGTTASWNALARRRGETGQWKRLQGKPRAIPVRSRTRSGTPPAPSSRPPTRRAQRRSWSEAGTPRPARSFRSRERGQATTRAILVQRVQRVQRVRRAQRVQRVRRAERRRRGTSSTVLSRWVEMRWRWIRSVSRWLRSVTVARILRERRPRARCPPWDSSPGRARTSPWPGSTTGRARLSVRCPRPAALVATLARAALGRTNGTQAGCQRTRHLTCDFKWNRRVWSRQQRQQRRLRGRRLLIPLWPIRTVPSVRQLRDGSSTWNLPIRPSRSGCPPNRSRRPPRAGERVALRRWPCLRRRCWRQAGERARWVTRSLARRRRRGPA